MRATLLFIFFATIINQTNSQSFTNWITGDTTDVVTTDHLPGIVLAGGGGDNDEAMQWMLNRGAGGDVVVIRASNSDGYNPYFFSELGVTVNSVETIRFNDASAANDPYVINQIQNAEVLFMAGGDQFDYYQYWKDTPIEDALHYLINEKQITIGGTSAGMAILGEAYYTPSGGSLTSEEGLGNPFHPDVEILGKGDFLNIPILEGVVTDTHYDQRERAGRHLTFLARLAQTHNDRHKGIACNEYTAVCVDQDGIASVFGEYPEYDDFAYFLETTCDSSFLPEVIEENTPLTWNLDGKAVTVYKVPGTVNGSNTFDLNDWLTGEGGSWENWYAVEGELFQVSGEPCVSTTSNEEVFANSSVKVYPNPIKGNLWVEAPIGSKVQVFNNLGVLIKEQQVVQNPIHFKTNDLPSGVYQLLVQFEKQTFSKKIIK